MKNLLLTTTGKIISAISKLSNRGSGSTWPGHIALSLEKNYIKNILKTSPTQVILIVGTNGKTTTGKILTTILERNLPADKRGKKKVIQNSSGANLLNGIASSLLVNTNSIGRLTADYAIFEIDENNLALILEELTPKAIIVLDLFRDQLDRYGELDSIAKRWQEAFAKLPYSTHLILNADDPLIAYLGQNTHATVSYFGLDQTKEEGRQLQHAADSLYCPRCNNKLHFQKIFYSHLGLWKCPHCRLARPMPNVASSYYPLDGSYNKYNTLAAALTAQAIGMAPAAVQQALHTVTPAFGRQEKVTVSGKQVQIFLAKNPTSFNETLETIHKKGAKYVAFALNDRIPDGRDVSWIWDIDMETYVKYFSAIFVSGDRAYDMALRIEYANEKENNYKNLRAFTNLSEMLTHALSEMPERETLYILPTYSAMLDVRKLLTGRKIL